LTQSAQVSEASEEEIGDEGADNFNPASMMSENGTGGFVLSMKDIKMEQGMDFITKFTRVFKKINTIDFGDNKLEKGQFQAFSQELKLNKYIQNVLVEKKHVDRDLQKEFEAEISKNKAIYDMQKSGLTQTNCKKLNLANKNLKDLNFLPKMLADFSCLETLDLSNSDMRSVANIKQLCEMID